MLRVAALTRKVIIEILDRKSFVSIFLSQELKSTHKYTFTRIQHTQTYKWRDGCVLCYVVFETTRLVLFDLQLRKWDYKSISIRLPFADATAAAV